MRQLHRLPPHPSLSLWGRAGVRVFSFLALLSCAVAAPIPPAAPEKAVYVAFQLDDEKELTDLLAKVGGRGNPAGNHRLAVSAHPNPLGNKYTRKDFTVDEEALKAKFEFLKKTDLPIILGIFAGKFFDSDAVADLEKDPNALMWDQDDTPLTREGIKGDKAGGTYFAISPASPGGPRNAYLDLYERNTRAIAKVVAAWIKENPGRVVAVSIAGETKYPPAKDREAKKKDGNKYRWTDYGPHALARFRAAITRRFMAMHSFPHGVEERAFASFLEEFAIPAGTFKGFAAIDPPRGKGRGAWDRMTPDNPYFMAWFRFRVDEVKSHVRDCARWAWESGIDTVPIYSHQAIWDKGFGETEEYHYWRAAPIETLDVGEITSPNRPGTLRIHPVLSLYGEKTGDKPFLAAVGKIGRAFPDRWGTLQYNPDGPDETDPKGFPVEEYLSRLKLLESEGARLVGVYAWGAPVGKKHFVRENFLEAVKRFLAE